MVREMNKAKLLRILDAVEHTIYYFVALALIVPVGMLFVSAAISVLQAAEVGILQTVLAVLDRVLLVFILVELLDTIRIISRERGIIIAEPFLLVGLIAVVRRILLVTAQIEQAAGTEEFQSLLAELGVMAGLVVVLTAALFFIRRTRRSEQEPERELERS
jgi:uncharacterized membrane protein (DUF373 family)